ncbi:hypothetical protein [Pseudokineococcus sp. 1T1Z-3]|uniref:hypothetical protein n=1 Tax=Pseudokineococcus sp. 1T1Z-3 TaxID=3132745 RepID=UPI0030966D4D
MSTPGEAETLGRDAGPEHWAGPLGRTTVEAVEELARQRLEIARPRAAVVAGDAVVPARRWSAAGVV